MHNSTARFTSRAENYVKYRPHYPQEIIEILREECGLTPEWKIADIGSGTGFSCEPFLKNGNTTCGVEPNDRMRTAAETFLDQYPNFTSVNGTAEDTTLADASIDMVTAGQAFHWFDLRPAKAEFKRILKPGGWVAIFWNRRKDGDPFLDAYQEAFRKYSSDCGQVRRNKADEPTMHSFFEDGKYVLRMTDNSQALDSEGLRGRVLSCSTSPEPGQPEYEPMVADLQTVFDRYQQNGRIIMRYELQIYIGQMM